MGLRATRRRERDQARDSVASGRLLLFVDTSGARLNITLSREGELLATYSALHPFSHASALLPVIDLLLEGQRATVGELAGLGLCIGPGSFTGLRVGMTTAKAIGAAGHLPTAAVSSTVLLAAGSGASGLVAPLIDARRGEVYSSLYRVEGAGSEPAEVLAPEAGAPLEAIARILDGAEGNVTLVGSACQTYDAIFRESGGSRVSWAPPSACTILPDVLARVCFGRLKDGITVDISQLEPLYVGRPPIHGK